MSLYWQPFSFSQKNWGTLTFEGHRYLRIWVISALEFKATVSSFTCGICYRHMMVFRFTSACWPFGCLYGRLILFYIFFQAHVGFKLRTHVTSRCNKFRIPLQGLLGSFELGFLKRFEQSIFGGDGFLTRYTETLTDWTAGTRDLFLDNVFLQLPTAKASPWTYAWP